MFVLDLAGHITTWNRGAQRIKGYTPEQIIGKHFSTFYPPEDLAARKPQRELEIVGRS
jgi:PAS domain S-box-containing protein